ncbi:MAG: nucleoside monophosphate kinase [Candidatus Saccharimonadales bacterium]
MIDFKKTPELATWLGSGSINFFGLPFAGKDSQAKRLDERFGGITLSSGDIFRNSVIPPKTKEMIDRGELAPTQDFIDIVLPYLKKDDLNGHPLMLSSVGRWHGEEEGVIGALNESGHPLKAVIYLTLDEAAAIERLDLEENATERGIRADDDKEKIFKRIDEFKMKTLPVIDYYRGVGLLIEVDASLPKDDVERIILEQLAKRAEEN